MTFADSLLSTADDNGQISYARALNVADSHGVACDFIDLYGSALRWIDAGVDAGEFLVWLGY